jgi:hypothetical protein
MDNAPTNTPEIKRNIEIPPDFSHNSQEGDHIRHLAGIVPGP